MAPLSPCNTDSHIPKPQPSHCYMIRKPYSNQTHQETKQQTAPANLTISKEPPQPLDHCHHSITPHQQAQCAARISPMCQCATEGKATLGKQADPRHVLLCLRQHCGRWSSWYTCRRLSPP